jgi:DNA-binding PucR family transcriptional regulator
MDYLAGKNSSNIAQVKNEAGLKSAKKQESHFSKLEKSILSCLSLDQQAVIFEKFLTPEIISVLQDKELVDCINAFFKNNLNISETSRNAFLHRNTLLYRIEKISRVTKLNIRNFDDAMTFKFLTIIYDKMNERMGRK